jgi:hypothetical protein
MYEETIVRTQSLSIFDAEEPLQESPGSTPATSKKCTYEDYQQLLKQWPDFTGADGTGDTEDETDVRCSYCDLYYPPYYVNVHKYVCVAEFDEADAEESLQESPGSTPATFKTGTYEDYQQFMKRRPDFTSDDGTCGAESESDVACPHCDLYYPQEYMFGHYRNCNKRLNRWNEEDLYKFVKERFDADPIPARFLTGRPPQKRSKCGFYL